MNSEAKTSKPANGTEPSVKFTPVPVVLFLIAGILVFFGQLYLDRYGGGFHGKVYEPYESWRMVENLQPKGAEGLLFEQGRQVYSAYACVTCHQATGMGAVGMAPPLAGSEWVLAPKPDRLVHIVHRGLTGPITVKGVPWNLQMPGLPGMSDEEMAAVLTFIRGNKDWGNNASAVTPEEVKAIRDPIRNRQTQTTAAELSAIPES